MPEKKQPLHLNIIALMKKKAGSVSSSHQAEKELMELGELLNQSDLLPSDRIVVARLAGEIADTLSSEGDQRNAKAYLVGLAKDIEGPLEPTSSHLGRTA